MVQEEVDPARGSEEEDARGGLRDALEALGSDDGRSGAGSSSVGGGEDDDYYNDDGDLGSAAPGGDAAASVVTNASLAGFFDLAPAEDFVARAATVGAFDPGLSYYPGPSFKRQRATVFI